MRLLLMIPAVMLMFSNIPFFYQMNMDEQNDEQEVQACCNNDEGMEGVCHSAPTCDHSSKTCDHSSKKCCDNEEPSCVCILCFQYSAPNQLLLKYNFSFKQPGPDFNLFKSLNWKNPFISIPWQPPDKV